MDEMKRIQDAAEKVLSVCGKADIGIILGSGLGDYADALEDVVKLPYSEIPGFPRSTVAGHAGMWCCGTLHGKRVVMMQGRFHYYEGYSMKDVTLPVRVMQKIGVKTLIVTNAAGGVNERYRPGDIMVISDHIKLNGASPMRGKNLPEFGDRFFDISRMYTPRLRELALRLAKDAALRVHEGVYFFMPGPQFETPAEIRAIRLLGGDAVGMSTVTEALTAAHCGIELLGFSVITNMAAGMLDQPLTTEEVSETGRMIEERFSAYLKSVIREMSVYE